MERGTFSAIVHAVVILGILVLAGQASFVEARRSRDSKPGGICDTYVSQYGYPCTEHQVTTSDGYILGLQNIPYGLNGAGNSPGRPVYIQHGLFAGSECWVYNGPQQSLAFKLADAGYDVWMGNIRGIDWSFGHTSLSPSESAFWDFTFDELALYDLPALLGFVHSATNSKVFYIAHSQGTSMLMAGLTGALSTQAEEMKDMLAAAVLMCPIAYMKNVPLQILKVSADMYCDKVLNIVGDQQFRLNGKLAGKLLEAVCEVPNLNCTNVIDSIFGPDAYRNVSNQPMYVSLGQPTSTRNIAHFAQMVRYGTFTMYDYGSSGNHAHYNQDSPPIYDLTKLDMPLFLAQGDKDTLADPTDVSILKDFLADQSPEVLELPEYTHVDFVNGMNAYLDVYPHIIDWLNQQ